MPIDPKDQEPNLPGLQTVSEVFLMWSKSLQAHGSTWSRAWKKMLKGKYGYKSLVRDFARTYQIQYDFAETLCRYPLKTIGEDSPSWVNFDLRWTRLNTGITQDLLTKNARTRGFDREQFQPLSTDLAPFGPSRVRFILKAEKTGDSETIKVTIRSAVFTESGGGSTELDFNDAAQLGRLNAALETEYAGAPASASGSIRPPRLADPSSQISGQYLGMVFDTNPQAASSSPYVIVMLTL